METVPEPFPNLLLCLPVGLRHFCGFLVGLLLQVEFGDAWIRFRCTCLLLFEKGAIWTFEASTKLFSGNISPSFFRLFESAATAFFCPAEDWY